MHQRHSHGIAQTFIIQYNIYLKTPVSGWELGYAKRVEAQLAETKGIVGYSLRAKFMQRSFWTLSVWESEEALQAFIHEGFHAGVMSVLIPDMATPNFVRWKIKGSACPPSWEEALKH